jgi:D-glycerate 3-kinase
MVELRWPAEQLFVEPRELAVLAERCREPFAAACAAMHIDADLSPLLESLYLPLAAWLRERRGRRDDALVSGVCGAQGSGKSTLCTLLKEVMIHGFGERVAVLSIDDVYETHDGRQELARRVHPLFATRGVPGTHDVALAVGTINRLLSQGDGESTALPAFDKAVDDRLPHSRWPRFHGPCDHVLFEGWCVGAMAETEESLLSPVNALERDEDADGRWRRAVNEHLAGEYRTLFGLMDTLLMLRVDGMHRVFQWRRLQEHKLAQAVAASGAAPSELRIMSDQEVDRFIMHYERLTRHILEEMPNRADMVFELDASHSAARMQINNPLREPRSSRCSRFRAAASPRPLAPDR